MHPFEEYELKQKAKQTSKAVKKELEDTKQLKKYDGNDIRRKSTIGHFRRK